MFSPYSFTVLDFSVIPLFTIYPILITAIMMPCTEIGKVEIDYSLCILLLPTGKVKWTKKPKEILGDTCHRFTVLRPNASDHFVTWAMTNEYDIDFSSFMCPDDGECQKVTHKFRTMFPKCNVSEAKVWFGFLQPDLSKYFAVARCKFKGYVNRHYYAYSMGKTSERLNIDPQEIVSGSLFYTKKPTRPDVSEVFMLERASFENKVGPSILLFYRTLSVDRPPKRIVARGDITLQSDQSVSCSRSNQCDNLVFLACNNKYQDKTYIFSLSIDELSKNPDKNETALAMLYKASFPIEFDPQMMGINVFLIEYPKKVTNFLVKGDNSWYHLVLEEKRRKFDQRCSAPESEIGHPFLCPIEMLPEHTLTFFSIRDNSLWMHTSYDNSIYDKLINTCYLMNDCFGCVLIKNLSPFNCIWEDDRCMSSSKNTSGNSNHCLVINGVDIDPRPASNESILSVMITGVDSTNSFMKAYLEVIDERNATKTIYASKYREKRVQFILNPEDRENVQQKDETLLVFENVKYNFVMKIALGEVERPDPPSNIKMIVLTGILITVLIALCTCLSYLSCKQFRESYFNLKTPSFLSEIRGRVGEMESNSQTGPDSASKGTFSSSSRSKVSGAQPSAPASQEPLSSYPEKKEPAIIDPSESSISTSESSGKGKKTSTTIDQLSSSK